MAIALSGTNSYQVKSKLTKLVADFTAEHSDLALEKLDGSEVSYEQIQSAIDSLPFLSTKKMVIVYDLSLNKQAAEELEQIIERAGNTTELIIVETKLDKRSVYYKQLKKLTDFTDYNELTEDQLAAWLIDEAKRLGASLSRTDSLYLVQRVGLDQMRLSRELEKLIQYNPQISKDTINLLCEENPSSTIFNLIDNVFSGNLKQALHIYDEQRRQRVEPQAIHGMFVWQMHAVAITCSAPANVNSGQIAKDSGISPYVIQKSQRIANRMGRTRIIEFMRLLRDIDYRGKHETLDYDEAMRYAIVSLSN